MGEMSAALYGHSHPVIREAIVSVLDDVGLSLGGTTAAERRHAALVCARFGLARVRFANTGTEANLHALNAARWFTGRRRVLVFAGGYHGAVLSFPGAPGAPPPGNNADRGEFIVGRYNDAEGARALIRAHATELAAVLVEPMQGAGGCIPAEAGFLAALAEEARRADALLVLDEVQTSRLAPGGLQRRLGVRPDLTVLGKFLGGGLPFGAFGGRADVMAAYDPRRPGALAHSGTFNNNTLTMHAGHAGLSRVWTDEANVAFNARGDALRERLRSASRGSRMSFTGLGSLLALHITDDGTEDIPRAEDVAERADLKDLFWLEMLEEGYWVAQRGNISLILDTPDEELDRFVKCVERFLQKHADIMML